MKKIINIFNIQLPATGIILPLLILCLNLFFFSFSTAQNFTEVSPKIVYPWQITTGAQRTDAYFHLLKDRNIAIVANRTTVIKNTHLADSLIGAGLQLKKIFCPEHGFRGNAEPGEFVNSAIDSKTGIPIISLYGKNKKPSPEDLIGIDIVIYDIQDVGVRFFTYISTLFYVMQSCAELDIPLLILDRPNPNGFYVDGPVLKPECSSFVGLNPIPVVYGMTAAEYALMVNGEAWLGKNLKCKLHIVNVIGYHHLCYYQLPLAPSPNLPNMEAIYLYPSLCLFEGTIVSIGRGTDMPFQVIGHPRFIDSSFSFTPRSIKGFSSDPPHKDVLCYGYNLKEYSYSFIKNYKRLYLFWLIESYKQLKHEKNFFNDFFDKLAGNHILRKQIIKGLSEEQIRQSWQSDLENFKSIRKKYLLYPDFE